MAINPISPTPYQMGPDQNIGQSLANLPQVYGQAQQGAARKEALSLANLGGAEGFTKGIQGLAAIGDLEGAGKLAAIQKTLAPETSAEMQAYSLAKRQGYQGGILDFMKEKAAAGATKVNTNTNVVNKGETKFDEAVGKDYGETFVALQKAARDSSGAQGNLNIMESLTKDPNFYSGAGGDAVTKIKQIGASAGITGADSAAPNELFKKISQKSVVDNLGSLGSGVSNADRQFIEGTVPNINNTPDGNRQIIGIARKVEQRKVEVAKQAREYAKTHGGRIDAGFDEHLSQWSAANPLFPQSGAGASSAPPAIAPPQQQEPRQAPDGNFYVPDPNRPGKYLRVIQ